MKLIIQNIAVEYQDQGSGRVILFLHGWQNSLHSFDALLPFLSSAGRLVRLDLPGFGASEAPKTDWNLGNYVQFVREFIRKLNLQVYALVGHSFGGRIILKGKAEYSLQAEKIILIASAGINQEPGLAKVIFKFLVKIGGLITLLPPLIFWREKLREKVYQRRGKDYFQAGSLRKTFLKIIKEDLASAASKITSPVLLVWGADDQETPLSNGQILRQLIRNSKLRVIKDAGHFVHQEKPQIVAGLIREFL